MTKCAESARIPSPYSGGNISISHLLYADDCMIFAKATVESARNIKDFLKRFEKNSGLAVNSYKTYMLLSNCNVDLQDAITAILNYIQEKLHIRYLGLPLFSSRMKIADCLPIIEKFRRRLTGHLLSFARRLQLIKFTLSVMHVYWSSCFLLLTNCIQLME